MGSEPLLREPGDERLDDAQELARPHLVEGVRTLDRSEGGMGDPPTDLLDPLLRQVALGGADHQRLVRDLAGKIPPVRRRVVPPAVNRDHRPPVGLVVGIRVPRERARRVGRIGRRHLVQHQQPDQIGTVRGDLVRGERAHRVTDHDRGENAQLVHESCDVVVHRLEGVVMGPFAAAVPARIRSDDPKPLAECDADMSPTVAGRPQAVQ